MNLHEYQAKQLFAEYGIPVPPGLIVRSADEAAQAADKLGGSRWVVKAQVHAGGRGKAGGIHIVDSPAAVGEAADSLLGSRLVTHQTGPGGLPIETLLVEQPSAVARELYVGALVDRAAERLVVMASASGGMDIEQVAATDPAAILTEHADPAAGLQPYQCRKLAFALGLEGKQIGAFTRILLGLARLFQDRDLSLVEINPLIVTEAGELVALDAKINVDDNALYRQTALGEMYDPSQEDEKERRAREHDLNYITLDGNIACMVNGAGLAMATMDLIKLHGGEPANFLDVGGGATAERVAEAFKLILSDPKVEAILVNIFGGIVRCDLIAEGIIQAVREVHVQLPVVVRLEGTNVERGLELLAESGFNITTAEHLTDAADKVVAAAARGEASRSG
ncbi:succinate--CoA ligase [ADP-forming] subunit beta [Thiohalobacter sp. COW1]|uniref:ADP-forming succinate--CoA ligase subunit beta n=1 Tax=Thiohalobacter sp. COW1 TaxID=2795687 RepID=UPI0019160807|nr:ADP-forming succinate--CoA ligase subunit beta [Thiohalobacter sp. COW1]BCO33077.1 succinate--CoA ligase [ADP-forming] subunit beta [Thiohalobacter sp. COW1]